jgi:dTDP-4-dehydrorhamnose reductase
MRVLVTGAGGQLGRELLRASWPADTELIGYTSAELDITDRDAVLAAAANADPDVIVNAAAYTKVDAAEAEEDLATAVNGTAVGHLADGANAADALLVHFSTDYVFDGTSPDWYRETDPTNPISAYGRSKLVGEELATKAERSVTLRTAWVYGALGKNFVTTILRLIAERDELGIVADQIGCPTATADLAQAVVDLAEATDGGATAPPGRLYHLTAPDEATWHQFAQAIIEYSTIDFAGPCRAITTADYPTPATRPANSRLDSTRIASELGITLTPWRDALGSVVAELES